ncbi:MAG: TetR/AcrR family transcriptional regulator [Brevinema sp.]
METKEMIQIAALNLFSQKGFNAASVRDIASAIGIKDSSLYFHYKNKQAILDSLMDKFISISEEMMVFMKHMSDSITMITDNDFYNVTEQYIKNYLMNEFVSKFIMIMTHERSHNEQLRKEYIRWCIENPIEFQMTIIKKLQDIGYLKKLDTRHIALEYYSPIFLYFNQYMTYDCGEKNNTLFLNSAMEATKNFLSIYKKER